MLETITDIFIQRIKRIVVTDEKMNMIPLAYLVTLDLPESIKHFFNQEVELWIREEEEKFTSNERFDYDMPEVRMLIDQIFDHLKQSANFHLTKFDQLLERAIKLELNFLIEPHRTLAQFLFKNSSKVSTMEIHDTLKYFFRYDYYKLAISEYFDMKYMREISQDQFVDLLNQIDEKAFADNRLETTLKTIKTIMAFLSDAQETQVNTLTIDVIRTALGDRKLDEYVEALDQLSQAEDRNELTFEELEALLRDGTFPGTEVTEEVSEEAIGYDQVEDIETSKPEIAVHEIEVSESHIVEEVEEEFDEEVEEEEYEEELEAELEEDEEKVSPDIAQDLADHVARQISTDSPLADLTPMFKGRTRRRILKKVFNKNEAEFLAFINQINQLRTWKEASRAIDDAFYERGMNPYSKEAISFSDIVYLRYFPKDKYVGADVPVDKF